MLSPISTNTPVLNVSEPQAPATTRASTPPPQARTHSPPPRPHSAPPAPRASLGQVTRFATQSALSVALETSRQSNSPQALDTVLKHLPGASAREQKAAASEFIKYGLESGEAVKLPHLDRLYDALIGLSKNDIGTPLKLTKALFNYGLNKLPDGQHGAGLEKITDALQSISLQQSCISHVSDLSKNRENFDELSILTQTAIDKFKLMYKHNLVSADVAYKIYELTNLKTAAAFAQDLALVRQTPGMTLSNASAEGILANIDDLSTEKAKVTLATHLVAQFEQLQLADPSAFLGRLTSSLQTLPDKDATAPLIAQINKRQQALGASDAATA